MATIIDSLLVTLGLDASAYDKSKKKVDAGLADTRKNAKQTGESFNDLAKNAAKFLAVLGGAVAIKRFVGDMIESNAALDRFSKNLQNSVETISAWSNAAEQAGGSAGELQGTMDMLSKAQTDLMLTGQSSLIPYFSALGLSLADVHGKALPVDEVLLNLSERFEGMDRTTANNMGRMMGLDQGTLNLLLKGRSEVELTIKRQKEFGAVSKEQAETASRLRVQLVQGRQNFEALGRSLFQLVTPALEATLRILGNVFKWMRDHQDFVIAFFTVLAAAITAYYLPVMIRAAAATWAAIAPMLAIVAPIVAVAAALAALWDDYQTWKAGGDSLIDWSKWEPGLEAAKRGITAFKNFVGDAFYRIFAGADAAKSALTGDWAHAKWAFNEAIHGNQSSAPSAPSAPAPSAPGNAPRGVRNNNPGNLNFAGQAGATKEGGAGGRFAVFGSMQEGVAALVRQIGLYVGRGKNTIRKILEVYAPSSENNTAAYIAAVSKSLGVGPDDPLDPGNADQVKGLVRAIADHENGRGKVSSADITGGFNLAAGRGIPGASRAAAGAGAGGVAAARQLERGGDTNVDTRIDKIEVVTQATDASGMARDMREAMDYLFPSQANVGLN